MAKVIVQSQLEVHILPALSDNYIYLIRHKESTECTAVDPGEAGPVLKYLKDKNWKLKSIVCTHHHHDHVDGVPELYEAYSCTVITSQYDFKRIPHASLAVGNGGELSLAGSTAQVVEIPGHTLGHMAIYLPDQGWLFTGDTLFAMGCGRLFEGTADQLYHSLQKLVQLPSQTKVFCGHEYTMKNSKFALSVDESNKNLLTRIAELESTIGSDPVTLPTSLELELNTNPFLRTSNPSLRRHLKLESATDVEVFRHLRELRNHF